MLTNPRHVLLVEDSLVNQKVLTHMLVEQGCEVTVAGDGQQGYEAYQRQSFDVVLMDVQMPVMDGLQATQLIRQHEASTGKYTVIIAVTAGMDRQSCLQAGMDDHIQKPVRVTILRAMLDHATQLSLSR